MTENILDDGHFERFMELSVELTGFSEAELASTGMARTYYDELALIVGESLAIELLNRSRALDALTADPLLGPIALNIVRMWYLGQWTRLNDKWREELEKDRSKGHKDKYDSFGRDTDHVISAQAYREGLVWRAIGTNPAGAKQPGFGTWGAPPR